MARHIEDITFQRFSRLVAIRISGRDDMGMVMWLCRCDCGSFKNVRAKSLKSSATRSCGCLLREKAAIIHTTHGESKSPEYASWRSMRTRCLVKTASNYHMYGGSGITIDERWDDYRNFLLDMGRKPSLRHSIDRIDNAKGYSPENCRWATNHIQSRNKTNNHLISAFGKEMCIKDWSQETGVPTATIIYRINAGWSAEKALTNRPWKRQ